MVCPIAVCYRRRSRDLRVHPQGLGPSATQVGRQVLTCTPLGHITSLESLCPVTETSPGAEPACRRRCIPSAERHACRWLSKAFDGANEGVCPPQDTMAGLSDSLTEGEGPWVLL